MTLSLPTEGPEPVLLDRAGIAGLIPHSGAMCWLDALLSWSADELVCRAVNHQDRDHPLRTASGLLAPCAIEYAAQAMALHGGLLAGGLAPSTAQQARAEVSAGYLASARSVRCHVLRLDEIEGALRIHALRAAGDGGQALYRFSLSDATGRLLVEGRASVVLNTPLPGLR